MSDDDIRTALQRHWQASDVHDFDAEHEIYAKDAVLDYPQSRERIKTVQHIKASRMAQPARKRFTLQRLLGEGGLWISEVVISYDGEPVHVVSIMEFKDGKVAHETQYFGEPFKAAPSRAPWAEAMD